MICLCKEYEDRTKKKADIQAMVEAPAVRLFALCRSTDEAMLATTAERISDLEEFKSLYLPDKCISEDEELVLFKGRVAFKRYIPSKHAMFGIKVFALCDTRGYYYDASVYVGNPTEPLPMTENLGAAAAIAVKQVQVPALEVRRKKVLGYAACNKQCNKQCISSETAPRSVREAKVHDWERNHQGSSKSMEPTVAVQLTQESQDHGAKTTCLVGDDDSSTIKKLTEAASADTKKTSVMPSEASAANLWRLSKSKRTASS